MIHPKPPASPATAFAILPALALLLIACFTAIVRAAAPTPADTLLIEPETFTALGPWQRTGDTIQSANMPAVAFAGFRVAQPGDYQVWTRSQDFPASQPGTRRFRIKIDETPLARESGAHGHEGWHWEHVGSARLDAGTHLLEIDDTARFYGRLEAILITRTGLDPNTQPRASLNRFHHDVIQPTRVAAVDDAAITPPAPDAIPLAELRNADIVIRFLPARAADGSPRIWRETVFLNSPASASPPPSAPVTSVAAGVEPLLLLSRDPSVAPVSFSAWFPSWPTTAQTDWDLEGRRLRRPADARDPFAAGDLTSLPPVALRVIDASTVELTYRSASTSLGAAARWTLPAAGHIVRVETSLTVPADAFYSLAFGAGPASTRDNITAVQLPPLYQLRRLPDEPVLITSSFTPHPLALIETRSRGATDRASPVTTGVIADPAALTRAWPSRTNPTHGFSLVGPAGEPHPFVFSPVLGGDGSRIARGQAVHAAWHIVTAPLPWSDVMRESDTALYQLEDYREPVSASLSVQALNIIDLIADDRASGWDPFLKGPANIESPDTVTHAAPLMYFSAARLTRDAAFYKKRALPTLEYLLSRPGAHFALTHEGNLYVTRATAKIDFKNVFFGSAVWQGVDALLGELNPWLRDYAADNGRPLRPRNNSAEPEWSGLLALYRQTPSPELLAKVRYEANSWIQRVQTLNAATTRGIQPFYNVSFYPYWWDLLDLYEITDDTRYRDAARQFAWQTVAGIWVTPPAAPPPATATLYPGGHITGSYYIWWLGNDRFRLGWPPRAGDRKHHEALVPVDLPVPEKTVPAWVVSPVGLGLEQPISWLTAAHQMSNIQLSSWAANLLRLSVATGDDYWRTFARNSIIGRGASYPGYYLSDFVDFMHDPDYPKKGPDLTSFYWHHVPVHLAMVVDYLVTDADTRTGGAIRFPYARQQGYVWFSNRIYGGQPGRVLDDNACWPWLDRRSFSVDTPKVDYLGARSRDKFHVVLLNQARGSATARIFIDPARTGITPGSTPRLRTTTDSADTGTPLAADADGRFTLPLERGGWAVLSFDARPDDVWPALPPLEARPVKITPTDTAWGEGRAFRIRSPYGTDSLYVALSGRPDGGKVTLLPDDDSTAPAQAIRYPYELSQADIPLSRDLRFRLRLERPGQPATETPLISLPGTK
ncbi:hypothetical protein OPIT5_02910 [Opitutaceae bacterium TAV5]|nr:hypothetical protein OPIT5_02910 [Opitutaceae bacterium TAV5]